MKNKFGKFLLATAAIGTAAAAYYYFQKKNPAETTTDDTDEDYDDFSESLDEDVDVPNYVTLQPENTSEEAAPTDTLTETLEEELKEVSEEASEEPLFEEKADIDLSGLPEGVEETVEEFFNDNTDAQ